MNQQSASLHLQYKILRDGAVWKWRNRYQGLKTKAHPEEQSFNRKMISWHDNQTERLKSVYSMFIGCNMEDLESFIAKIQPVESSPNPPVDIWGVYKIICKGHDEEEYQSEEDFKKEFQFLEEAMQRVDETVLANEDVEMNDAELNDAMNCHRIHKKRLQDLLEKFEIQNSTVFGDEQLRLILGD